MLGRLIFFILIFTSNLSYSDDNNQLLLHENPKNIHEFSLKNLKGDKKEFKKKTSGILILNFWATWCPPCIKEIPDLLVLEKKFKNIEVAFISVNHQINKTVPKFLKKHNLTDLAVYNDEKLEVSRKFNVKLIPASIIIDKNLREVSRVEGYINWLDQKTVQFLKNIL